MPEKPEALVFTVRDVAEILAKLAAKNSRDHALKPRMVRYWDREGGIQPSRVNVDGARLYTLTDIALLRLVGRVQDVISGFQLRSALAYHGADWRAEIARRQPVVVAWRAAVACLTTPATVKRDCPNAIHTERLDVLWDGLEQAAKAQQEKHPRIWAGWWMPREQASRLYREQRA